MAGRGYDGGAYRRLRRMLLDPPVPCAHCQRRQATELDHDPPLAMHVHVQGSGCCRLIPSCGPCNREGGRQVWSGEWRPGASPVEADLPPEHGGVSFDDPRWDRPWLKELRAVPRDAVWPRLMSVPHPRAVGSLGPEFIEWAEARTGRPLRWWQRLVATRLLEIDADGRLVWETLVLSLARQLGKSWLLRELCFWRIHQGERFGEPQDVLHTGKDLAVCKEVQRPARVWSKARRDRYHVREVNGQEEIELELDGSRWMLRAKEAVYGYAASFGAADEAWKVKASSIEEGLTPTMAEREQAQLALVSTAHRLATSLMIGRRQLALSELETPDADLLIEWSAPIGAELEHRDAWRLASPHWTARRERMIAKQLELARAGESSDPDEPDPIEAFRAQWLNQWPRRRVEPRGATEDLLPAGMWQELTDTELDPLDPVYVAIEDDFGRGAAVAAAGRLADGRIELDGWLCVDWDEAIADVERLSIFRPVRMLTVGGSLIDRVPAMMRPRPAVGNTALTRGGLALLRDLSQTGMVCHDETTGQLDQALIAAQVREAAAGLTLVGKGPTHLVRAAVWALAAAHKPAKVPAIH